MYLYDGSGGRGIKNIENYLGLTESFYYKILSIVFWSSIIGNIIFVSSIIGFLGKESYLFYLLIKINKIVICISIIFSFFVFRDCYKRAKIRQYGVLLLIFLLIIMILGILIPSLII